MIVFFVNIRESEMTRSSWHQYERKRFRRLLFVSVVIVMNNMSILCLFKSSKTIDMCGFSQPQSNWKRITEVWWQILLAKKERKKSVKEIFHSFHVNRERERRTVWQSNWIRFPGWEGMSSIEVKSSHEWISHPRRTSSNNNFLHPSYEININLQRI